MLAHRQAAFKKQQGARKLCWHIYRLSPANVFPTRESWGHSFVNLLSEKFGTEEAPRFDSVFKQNAVEGLCSAGVGKRSIIRSCLASALIVLRPRVRVGTFKNVLVAAAAGGMHVSKL